ncbi:MAG: replication restart helicase PriA [Actinomycetota bacterium]
MPTTSAASSPDRVPVAAVVPLVPAWRVDKTFDYLIPDDLDVRVGSLVAVPFGNRKLRGIVAAVSELEPDGKLASIERLVVDVPVATAATVELLDWVSTRYVAPRGKTFARTVPPRVRVKPRTTTEAVPRSEPKVVPSYRGGGELLDAIATGRTGVSTLRVLPGEDRGALISELVASAVVVGEGSALVLVPEVRYGSAILDRLAREFPTFRRIDSSVSEGDRSRGWLELAEGQPLAGGGRGAVFAPARRLRLIVVDEEHHRTYKDDRSPRFDARRVAVERARREGAICVLSSASPSVESGGAARAGNFGWVEPDRATTRNARPLVEFVDKDRDRPVTHELHERIRDVVRAGGKAALLVPTRGYARALWCADCRRSVRCPRCEAGLIYGQGTRTVRCPRCAWTAAAPDVCPSCGSTEFRFVGAGSERLAEQVAKSFPRAAVRRVDPEVLDSTGPPTEGDIYVTTWIGTKPAIRPDVSLVGVLDADAMIRRPDFRAGENAYQAMVEMAEWAGPASDGGRLVIQTDEAGHHCLQAIARADYSFFLERELRIREELGYPPFGELIKVGVYGADRDRLSDAVTEAARGAGARVLGPIDVGFGEDKRLELLLKCTDADAVSSGLRDIVTQAPVGSRLRIDVDPR